MAAGVKLILTFDDTTGKTVQYSYGYAKANATKANVVALATAMINNTGVYERKLATLKKALIRETTESEFDLEGTIFAPQTTYLANPEETETTDPGKVVTTEEIKTR